MANLDKRRKSPERRGGARANTGGRRPGAGRKTSFVPPETMALIGPPPANPLAKSGWWATMIEVLTAGVLEGKPWRELLALAVRSAGTSSKLIPEAIRYNALELLREDREDRTAADAPDDEPIGPGDSNATRPTPLRRDPSRS